MNTTALVLFLGVLFTAKGAAITDDPDNVLKMLGYVGLLIGGFLLTVAVEMIQ